MKRHSKTLVFGACTAFLVRSLLSAEASETWYSDVPEYSSSYDGVAYMTQENFASGYDDGSFKPEAEVNRVEALRMILNATGHDSTNQILEAAPSFPDMEENAWYLLDVSLAYQLEVMTGNEDGTLRPNNPVNRAEALKMLLKAADRDEDLQNGPSNDWFSPYLYYATEHALLVPDATGDYLPGASLTRGELCDLLYRFANEPYTGTVEYGIASYYGSSFDGHDTASGIPLDTDGYMAAHKSLPFGTVLRITNLATNTFVDVTVVDRGPYTEGYVVDLTPTAFEQIGTLSTGLLNVRLEVLK